SRVDRGGDAGHAAEVLRIDAERGAAPIDVGVQVDQPRRDDVLRDITDVGPGIAFQSWADALHLAAGKRPVGYRVELLRRVDDAAAAQNQVVAHSRSLPMAGRPAHDWVQQSLRHGRSGGCNDAQALAIRNTPDLAFARDGEPSVRLNLDLQCLG